MKNQHLQNHQAEPKKKPASRQSRHNARPPEDPRDSLGNAIGAGICLLSSKHIPQPRLLCEHMAAHVMRCGRLELYARWSEKPTKRQFGQIKTGLERIASGEPLQYVLGNAEFMGREFQVNRHCLIPRPETEELVDWIIGFAPLWAAEKPRVADVGTGSGCIAVTLAIERPQGIYMALDVSTKALGMARKNAETHNIEHKIKFKTADILSGVRSGSLNAVVSNPPYVPTAAWRRLPCHIRKHEPRIALDGGKNGLDIIRPLITQAFRTLKSHGFLFMEIDEKTNIKNLLHQAGFRKHTLKNDISEKQRMVMAEK